MIFRRKAPQGDRTFAVEGGEVTVPAAMTEAEYERIKTAWLDKSSPNNAHHVRLLTPLPARARTRLAVQRRIDRTGAWLCGHQASWAARWLWKACRML